MKAGPPPIIWVLHAVRPDRGGQTDDHDRRLDTVEVGRLRDLLEQLRRQRTVVPLDELIAASDRRGLASISFDDGLRSVVELGLPVFEALDVPVTLFVNGHVLEGGRCWRDKLRWIVAEGLEDEWRQFTKDRFFLAGTGMVSATKSPRFDSREVDRRLDLFLNRCGATLPPSPGMTLEELPDHPLLSYGNHGYHHYVMSSLDRKHQEDEVTATARVLDRRPELRHSRLFAAPFGGRGHFDRRLVAILKQTNHRGLLTTRPRPCPRFPSPSSFEILGRLNPICAGRTFGLHRTSR